MIYNDAEVRDEAKDWIELESGVVFAGAGDAKSGMLTKGLYRVVFDEYGFTGDQVVAVKLENDDSMVWSVSIHGLTGHMEVERSELGEIVQPLPVGEGSF